LVLLFFLLIVSDKLSIHRQITKRQHSELGKAYFLCLLFHGKASYSQDSFAKLPNGIPPTVESKIGQVSNQSLVENADIQSITIKICNKTETKKMKEYKKRVADQILLDKLESSGAVLIEGPQ